MHTRARAHAHTHTQIRSGECVEQLDSRRYTWLVLIPVLVLALRGDALPITGELSVIPRERVQASAPAAAFLSESTFISSPTSLS